MENNQYPSLKEQAKNLANMAKIIASDSLKGKRLLTNKKEQEERLSICKTCSFYDEKQIRCTQCGCFLEAKVKVASQYCPVGKWRQVDSPGKT